MADSPTVAELFVASGVLSRTERSRMLRLFALTGRVDAALAEQCLGLVASRVRIELDAPEFADLVDASTRRLRPEIAEIVLGEMSEADLDEMTSLVLDLVMARPTVDNAVVWSLVDNGCRDPRLLDHLVRIEADPASDELQATSRINVFGVRIGLDPQLVTLRRAEAMLAADRIDRCLALSEEVVGAGEGAAARRAYELAGIAEVRLGNCVRAVEIFRAGAPASDEAVTAAVTAALGAGLVEDLRHFATLSSRFTTFTGGWGRSFVQGLVASLEGDGTEGLTLLVRATQALKYAGRSSQLLSQSPAAIAAGAALGQGDGPVALTVLEQAQVALIGGRYGDQSHRLALAWILMLTGDLDGAEAALAEVGEDDLGSPLHNLQRYTIRIGLARRRGNVAALKAAWQEVRGHLLWLHVDLFTLPMVGELHVAAARVEDPLRLTAQVDEGRALLNRLGNPVVWSALFDWAGVQAAIIGQRPEALRPHAAALAANASRSDFARRLAAAGQAWVAVLQDQVDGEAVRNAAVDLADSGLGWDASRLAGLAAVRSGDPTVARELLRLARRFDSQGSGLDDGASPVSGRSVLSERELMVSRLIVAGLGYREIGQRLFISPRTVEHHVARIRRRLGAGDRRELLAQLQEIVERERVSEL